MPLPVHLLTGFLGSGKTTLLSRLLHQPAFADTAVIINELGDVGLDHLLVDRGSEDDVVLLDSGCLCCALGNSLQETLESLHFRRHRGEIPAFARVVIETTGVADPGPIAATLALDGAIARHYRLGSIVTVVDAIHGEAQLSRFPEARRQVAMADRIVVSKGDVAADGIVHVMAILAKANPYAVRTTASSGDIPATDVFVDVHAPQALRELSNATHDHAHDHEHPHDHLAEQDITATTIRLDAPLAWPRYAAWVQWAQRTLGERLLRMKGAVRMDDGQAHALHAVMRLFSPPVPLPSLPDAMGEGVIVLVLQDVSPALQDEARRRLIAD
ncbi:MAG: GTP-binding protein [Betaproteobacteria bacterium]